MRGLEGYAVALQRSAKRDDPPARERGSGPSIHDRRPDSCFVTHSAKTAERLAWQEGQRLRVRQEKASRCSPWQRGQRILAKPPIGRPQSW